MNVTLDLGGTPQPKQVEFMKAHHKYICFGGARGGGKSWVVRTKATLLALRYPGIRIAIIRDTYTDLKDNHIIPLQAIIPPAVAKYKEMDKSFVFVNKSRIKCTYFGCEGDARKFQGQEYDVIFLEEATHFTESVNVILKACNRGVNDFPKRIYYTCNPDGIGFSWVKRLFVTRKYEKDEDPNDYLFIQSLVTDNAVLLEKDPDYLKKLDSLPDDFKQRWRYGSWEFALGQYFDEFRREIHVCSPFPIPDDWRRYRAIDYGLDRLACLWIAISPLKRVYVYKELCESNLTISASARKINEFTLEGEKISETFAPPDLWNRSQETGRSKALIFGESGLTLTKSNNDREAGWLAIKELLARDAEGNSKICIFDNCQELIRCLPDLQRDEKNPSDSRTEPHDITHAPDALRYFAIAWTSPASPPETKRVKYRPDQLEDWRNARSEAERKLLIERYGGMPM